MTFQSLHPDRVVLVMLSTLGVLVIGCTMPDPPALTSIYQARDALAASKTAGAADRFPDAFAELEKRYLASRGTFYACQEDRASEIALAVVRDANRLADKRPVPPRPSLGPNRLPDVAIQLFSEGEVNEPLAFSARGTSDPDGDSLTFQWSFGDGATSSLRNPTHVYAAPGTYTVELTVTDDQGGSDTISESINIMRQMALQPMQDRVFFESNQSTLTSTTSARLDLMAAEMADNPQLRAEIVGHTDATGSKAHNLRLSQQRAKAVRDYLIAKGIPASHVSLEGKGETQPLAPNHTTGGRAKNRRVELTVRSLERQ